MPTPEQPRNRFAAMLGRAIMRTMGWRAEGELPDVDKFVVVGAHHTSNWDFVMFLAYRLSTGLDLHWYAKDSLFRWPVGRLLRALGGIPIRRDRHENVVAQAIDAFARHDRFVLCITPEGTRDKVDRWKMGFYHIARGADVPILLSAFDFGNKRLLIGPTIWPTGDVDADMAPVYDFYRPIVPKYPERAFDAG